MSFKLQAGPLITRICLLSKPTGVEKAVLVNLIGFLSTEKLLSVTTTPAFPNSLELEFRSRTLILPVGYSLIIDRLNYPSLRVEKSASTIEPAAVSMPVPIASLSSEPQPSFQE